MKRQKYNSDQAVKKMRGLRGSKVTLTIMREGFKKFKDFEITRDTIHVRSVKKETLERVIPTCAW